jgi:hypothetical protein
MIEIQDGEVRFTAIDAWMRSEVFVCSDLAHRAVSFVLPTRLL